MVELNGNYQTYPDDRELEDQNSQSNVFRRLLSCLYLYTFGSCRYSKTSLTHKDRLELRSLWKSASAALVDTQSTSLRQDQDQEDHWKRKARKADCIMKKRIRHHFRDHIRKWTHVERPRFPWKMILHVLLVIVVTVQVRIYNYNYCVDIKFITA